MLTIGTKSVERDDHVGGAGACHGLEWMCGDQLTQCWLLTWFQYLTQFTAKPIHATKIYLTVKV